MKVSKDHAKIICRLGELEKCCSYLGAGKEGLLCLKDTPFREMIIDKREAGTMGSKGDNCQGPPDFLGWEEVKPS